VLPETAAVTAQTHHCIRTKKPMKPLGELSVGGFGRGSGGKPATSRLCMSGIAAWAWFGF
jgi:hypothetical protein